MADLLDKETSQGIARINATLAQFEDFDDFYGIKDGDGMYLPPEDCVAVW